MRNTKKAISILLTLLMVVGMMSTFAFAAAGTGTITIQNASKGETYKAFKIFNAKVDPATQGITYQELTSGQIENEHLKAVFEKDKAGYIVKKTAVTDEAVIAAIKAYVGDDTVNLAVAKSVKATGNTVTMSGLEYGYYYVTSTLGSAISITSTNPEVTIKDKNTTGPVIPGEEGKLKKSNKESVSIGDTVTYTVKFTATNYYAKTEGGESKQIKQYVINDTLPAFLKDVKVESLKIGDTAITPTPQFNNKKIVIDWVDNENNSLYNNKTDIEIIYTAKVTDNGIVYDGEGNKNEVTISWTYVDGTTPGTDDKITGSDTIFTYALAIKKINKNGEALPGAQFKVPFAVEGSNGDYTVTGEGSTVVDCDAAGVVIIKGVAAGKYNIEETLAPDGYNILSEPFEVEAVKSGKTITEWTQYIKDGNITATQIAGSKAIIYSNATLAASVTAIVNYKGTELPTTGGIGTTIFYLIGAILVIGAGVVFVTRRRMHSDK